MTHVYEFSSHYFNMDSTLFASAESAFRLVFQNEPIEWRPYGDGYAAYLTDRSQRLSPVAMLHRRKVYD